VRSAWQEPIPRLLIFDNCENTEIFDQLQPPTGNCRILVTSRRSVWPRGIEIFSLDVLERTDSIALLIHDRDDLAANDPDINAIAKTLGDLPLALHLAGRYLDTYRDDGGEEFPAVMGLLVGELGEEVFIDAPEDVAGDLFQFIWIEGA
jgi:hypothetical protein